jgi:hypothetical protein
LRTDIVAGAILLVVSAAFWVQRDYTDRLAGQFPDFVLIVLIALGVFMIVNGIWRGDRTRAPREVNLPRLGAAAALIVAWAVLMGLIGFTISGVIVFVLMALMVRNTRPTPRTVTIDLVAGLVVVIGTFLIFTQLLLVPLPVSTLIGM